MSEDKNEVETEAPVVGEYDERARRMGWRPKEEYNGPESKWVDAKTFVERGEQELPVLRERYRKLDDRLASTERALTESHGTISGLSTKVSEQSEVLGELRELTVKAEKRGRDQALRELTARERQAVQEADTATYDNIQTQKRELMEPVTVVKPKPVADVPAPKAPDNTLPPADAATVTSWISENKWYNEDPEMQAVATTIHGFKRQSSPNQPLSDNLAEVKEKIMELYPHKFQAPRRAAPVSGGSPPPPKPKGKTVADLPAEAKDALSRLKRQIPNYTDKEYLDVYFGDEA